MNINLICVGSIKEEYLVNGINEYLKRIKLFVNFKIIEVKEYCTSDILKNITNEGKEILKHISKDDYCVTLEINGNMLDSVSFSKFINNHFCYSPKTLTFIIGGSDGLSSEVTSRSDYKLSFSKLTFPHQLMRMIFLEQIYRAYSIINNQKYHK